MPPPPPIRTVVEGGVFPARQSAVLIVAAAPEPGLGVLQRCVRTAAGGLFGPSAVNRIVSLSESSVALVLVPEGATWGRVADFASAQSLEAAVAAELATVGLKDAAVAAISDGPPLTAAKRHREAATQRLRHLEMETRQRAATSVDRHRLAALLESRVLRTFFQPIVDAHTGELLGHEALTRGPAGHHWERPDRLIEVAGTVGMAAMLEWEMLWLARERARECLGDHGLLFLNAPATDLWSAAEMAEWDRQETVDLFPWNRSVIEVSERSPIADLPLVSEVRSRARQRGMRLALDDVGAGYAGLATLALLAPEFIKVDIGLVRDCDTDTSHQAAVVALVEYARRTGAQVIGEGVETPSELEALQRMGVHYVQGFLIGRPAAVPAGVDHRLFPSARREDEPAGLARGSALVHRG